MKIKVILLALFVIVFLTGCWNYRELNDMAIVGAIGIDYDSEKKEFITVAQIFNAKKSQSDSSGSGGGQQSPITVYESRAKTIHEALRNVTYESPRKLYIGHLEIIILGENLVKEHLLESMDFLFRDSESRKDFDVIVVKDISISEALKVLTPLESIPASSLKEGLKTNSMFVGAESAISYDKLLSIVYSPGIEAVLPVLIGVGNPKEGDTTKNTQSSDPSADIKFDGTAIFKGHKMIGYLDRQQSLGYGLAVGKVKSSVISFICDDKDNYASIELINASSKLAVVIKDNKPNGKIDVIMVAALSEINCNIDIRNNKELEKVTKMAKNHVKQLISKTVETVQTKYGSDIFGFGSFLYHEQNKYWEKNEKDWNKKFSTMPVEVTVDIKIDRKGSSTTSAMNGDKKIND